MYYVLPLYCTISTETCFVIHLPVQKISYLKGNIKTSRFPPRQIDKDPLKVLTVVTTSPVE